MKLAGLQTARIARAFAELGPKAHEAACRFLTAMINAEHRDRVLRLIARRRSRAPARAEPRRWRAMKTVPAVLADDAPHLLVVDDDRRIRDLLSRFLLARATA